MKRQKTEKKETKDDDEDDAKLDGRTTTWLNE